MIEVHSVGAGGGSIARLDQGGALVVGPESAGADPGPACYGKGDHVTVTDANLILGRLQPEHFLGGRLTLDRARAQGFMDALAAEMGTGVRDAALGVVRVVNSSMERAIRAISLERGYDPRDFTLAAFGGAGPMHACDLARELRIPRVLVPPNPGIQSAMGVAMADVVKDYSRTVMVAGADATNESLQNGFAVLESQAREDMEGEGLEVERARALRAVDVRYVGQSYELPVDYVPRRKGPPGFHRPGIPQGPPPALRVRRPLGAPGDREPAPQDGTPNGQAPWPAPRAGGRGSQGGLDWRSGGHI